MDVIRIALHVIPGARSDAVLGWEGDRLWVRVGAPASEGRANAALCRLVALLVGVAPADVRIESGVAGRDKTVTVTTVDGTRVTNALVAFGARRPSG